MADTSNYQHDSSESNDKFEVVMTLLKMKKVQQEKVLKQL